MNLFDSLWNIVNYWKNSESSKVDSCEGVAFSILSLIDGCQIFNEGYFIYPCSNMDNICYNINEGNNFRPLNQECINNDTYLHEIFYSRRLC